MLFNVEGMRGIVDISASVCVNIFNDPPSINIYTFEEIMCPLVNLCYIIVVFETNGANNANIV